MDALAQPTGAYAAAVPVTLPSGQTIYATASVPVDLAGNYVAKAAAAIATGQIAVGTSATLVVAGRPGRASVVLTPTTSTVYYVGPAGVTSATGIYVAAGASITLATTAAVYAAGASALTITFIETF